MIGWTRVVTYDKGRKHSKHVEERGSINVRAWELAALGLVGLAWWQLEELKKSTQGWSIFDFLSSLQGVSMPTGLPSMDFWGWLLKLTPITPVL